MITTESPAGHSHVPARLLRKRKIALAPGLDVCPANGAIVAAPVLSARTARELQGLLSAGDRFARLA
jgi:hypothetical protein